MAQDESQIPEPESSEDRAELAALATEIGVPVDYVSFGYAISDDAYHD